MLTYNYPCSLVFTYVYEFIRVYLCLDFCNYVYQSLLVFAYV